MGLGSARGGGQRVAVRLREREMGDHNTGLAGRDRPDPGGPRADPVRPEGVPGRFAEAGRVAPAGDGGISDRGGLDHWDGVIFWPLMERSGGYFRVGGLLIQWSPSGLATIASVIGLAAFTATRRRMGPGQKALAVFLVTILLLWGPIRGFSDAMTEILWSAYAERFGSLPGVVRDGDSKHRSSPNVPGFRRADPTHPRDSVECEAIPLDRVRGALSWRSPWRNLAPRCAPDHRVYRDDEWLEGRSGRCPGMARERRRPTARDSAG